MTTWYAKTNGDLSVILYNDQAGGGGSDSAWGSMDDADSVDSNGKTVDIEVVGWTRAALIATGGGFTYSLTGDRVITVGIMGGTATCLTLTHTSGNSLTVNGDVAGGSSFGAIGINNDSTGNLIVNGDVSGGSNGGACGIENGSSGELTINGDVSGGSVAIGVKNNSTGPVTINGSVSGGTGSDAWGIDNNSTGVVTLNLGTLVLDPALASPFNGKNIYFTFGIVSYFSEVGGQVRTLSTNRGLRGRYK